MLLKIKGINQFRDWWFIDNIERLVTGDTLYNVKDGTYKLEDGTFSESDEANLIVIDEEVEKVKGVENECFVPVVRIGCKLSNGEEYIVLTNTRAFLCNDQGSTVETIC